MLDDAFRYARDLYWDRGAKMIPLAVCMVIIPLIAGYMVEILRGTKVFVEDLGWGKLFIDGIKLIVIQLIYAIPLFLVFLFFLVRTIPALRTGSPMAIFSMAGELIIGFLILIVLYILIGIFSTIGLVRFARTGKMLNAFSFGAILGQISRIGWGFYILALIVLGFVCLISLVGSLAYANSLLMPLILLLVYPGVLVFNARFIALIYDRTASPAQPAA